MTEITNQNEEKATQENPLFKPEIWEVIDPQFNWAAMDKDGTICFYENKPSCDDDSFWFTDDGDWIEADYRLISINGKKSQWKSSLTKRPSVED